MYQQILFFICFLWQSLTNNSSFFVMLQFGFLFVSISVNFLLFHSNVLIHIYRLLVVVMFIASGTIKDFI